MPDSQIPVRVTVIDLLARARDVLDCLALHQPDDLGLLVELSLLLRRAEIVVGHMLTGDEYQAHVRHTTALRDMLLTKATDASHLTCR